MNTTPVPPDVSPTGRCSRVCLGISLALLGAALIRAITTGHARLGSHFFCAAAVLFAIGASCHPRLRKWAFTIWISTGVVVGMTVPQWFIGIGDFKFTVLFVPILQVIMFGMGTTLSVDDFARVIRMPSGVVMGLVGQYTIMPLLGYGLAKLSGLPPEVAAGMVLVGAAPPGLAANVMAYVARANVAMAVTMTALASLMAPVMTPLLMRFLAGEMITVDAQKMMWNITKMAVLPVLAGLAVNRWLYHRMTWLGRVMPIVSMSGIILLTVLTIAIGRDNLLQLGAKLIVLCFLHNLGGYAIAYISCRCLRFDQTTSRTIALEVGLQNAGMASGIAAGLGKVATLGLAPIIFGPVMNTTGSTLANWWRTHPVTDEKEPR